MYAQPVHVTLVGDHPDGENHDMGVTTRTAARDFLDVEPGGMQIAQPSTPYSHGPPSPPPVNVPVLTRSADSLAFVALEAQPGSVLMTGEYPEELRRSVATEDREAWQYEQRWNAQQIMQGLYLGPTKIVRDAEFMQTKQITLLVVVCSEWVKRARLKSVTAAQATFGLQVEYVALESLTQTIHDMPGILQSLLDHRKSMIGAGKESNILITCETGNDRSAALVAAYLISLYGERTVTVIQYLCMRRFCCTFNEETKRMLLAWEDIAAATSNVQRQHAEREASPMVTNEDVADVRKKRTRGESNDVDMEVEEQFAGRNSYAPFVDTE